VLAIGVSALITLLCVLVNYLAPQRALEMLMALVVSSLVINWAMISLSHLKFRQSLNKRGIEPGFKSLWYPFSNYLCLAFVALILGVMLLIPGINLSVYAIPFWLAFIGLCYWLKTRAA
jgi:aromatic amino acid transport protein AroP